MTAVTGSHVEHPNTVFNTTPFDANDRGKSFLKLPNCLIYVQHVCSIVMCQPV